MPYSKKTRKIIAAFLQKGADQYAKVIDLDQFTPVFPDERKDLSSPTEVDRQDLACFRLGVEDSPAKGRSQRKNTQSESKNFWKKL